VLPRKAPWIGQAHDAGDAARAVSGRV
jgi:hypothetical protein